MKKNLNIEETLLSLGYSLFDRGEYWQTNALYRGGDNQTALQIYKDTGVWRDYVEGGGFLPFLALLEKSKSLIDEESFKKILEQDNLNLNEVQKTKEIGVETENFFDNEILDTLLPHYAFYEKKGISIDILKNLRAGLCTQGQMYQRFVFPVFNSFNKIIGFAGRDMSTNSSRPKWKHLGKKTKWIYPLYTEKGYFEFNENEDLVLVESIGDFLSIRQNSTKNCLVSFGLDLSPSLISAIISLSFDKIIIAFNNDSSSKENRGKNAAIKNFLKLLSYFDSNKLRICLPVKNDFGDMNKEDFEAWNNKLKKIKNSNQKELIIEQAERLIKERKISKNLQKNLNILKNDC